MVVSLLEALNINVFVHFDDTGDEVKEKEMAIQEVEPPQTAEEINKAYVEDEGLKSNGEYEAPMGGNAQQRYAAVGDDNPFAEVSGQTSDFVPRKSAWE
jgi:hypothetical protein